MNNKNEIGEEIERILNFIVAQPLRDDGGCGHEVLLGCVRIESILQRPYGTRLVLTELIRFWFYELLVLRAEHEESTCTVSSVRIEIKKTARQFLEPIVKDVDETCDLQSYANSLVAASGQTMGHFGPETLGVLRGLNQLVLLSCYGDEIIGGICVALEDKKAKRFVSWLLSIGLRVPQDSRAKAENRLESYIAALMKIEKRCRSTGGRYIYSPIKQAAMYCAIIALEQMGCSRRGAARSLRNMHIFLGKKEQRDLLKPSRRWIR